MKKIFTLVLALCSLSAWAHDFAVDGIYYNYLDGNNVEVTYRGSDFDSFEEYYGAVTIPASVTYNGTTYSVTSIGDGAFIYCSSLTSVTIPNSVTSIGNNAFHICESLTSVTIPNSVTSIGEYAFYFCSFLTSVTIPNSVTSIGDGVFCYCSSLTSITIPNSVTSIGDDVFNSCSSLTSVIVEKGNSIYDSRENCNAIIETATNTLIAGCQNTTIPNSVTSIGDDAFSGCSSLTSITIPNSVTSIGISAFFGCRSLTSVTIPNSVTSIGGWAFYNCSFLTSVTIPNRVTSIGENAFAGCSKLQDVYCYAVEPPTAYDSSFSQYNAFLYIPCENKKAYMLDEVFGNFKYIECISSDGVKTNDVVITPSTNDVTITWPTEDNADTYTIVIKKGDEAFCTLTFNADGQLLNIAFAPSRDVNKHPTQYAEQTVNGYRFTVTGLTEATKYAYDITTKDAAKKTIAAYSGEFTTKGGTTTDMDNISSPVTTCQKLIRNGQLVILRDGKTYTTMGQEM